MRAIWYNIEVASQENTDISSGYVCVVWDKGSSVMDFDHHLYQHIMHYEMTAWPVKLIASHICCVPVLNLSDGKANSTCVDRQEDSDTDKFS